jgi:hypothetical protein
MASELWRAERLMRNFLDAASGSSAPGSGLDPVSEKGNLSQETKF